MDVPPICFEDAFCDGAVLINEEGERIHQSVIELGELDIDEHGLRLGDAFTGWDAVQCPGFDLPRGRARVRLALSRYEKDGDERISAAELRFVERADVAVDSWVDVDGVGVDSGTAAFISGPGELTDTESEAMLAAVEPTWQTTHCRLMHRVRDMTIALFSSGMGDGGYTGFWGLAADGKPVVFALDFGLLDGRPLFATATLRQPLRWGKQVLVGLDGLAVRAKIRWFDSMRLRVNPGLSYGVRGGWRLADGSFVSEHAHFTGGSDKWFWLLPPTPDAQFELRAITGYGPFERVE